MSGVRPKKNPMEDKKILQQDNYYESTNNA